MTKEAVLYPSSRERWLWCRSKYRHARREFFEVVNARRHGEFFDLPSLLNARALIDALGYFQSTWDDYGWSTVPADKIPEFLFCDPDGIVLEEYGGRDGRREYRWLTTHDTPYDWRYKVNTRNAYRRCPHAILRKRLRAGADQTCGCGVGSSIGCIPGWGQCVMKDVDFVTPREGKR